MDENTDTQWAGGCLVELIDGVMDRKMNGYRIGDEQMMDRQTDGLIDR